MATKNKKADTAAADAAPAPATPPSVPLLVSVKVLTGGIKIAGGTAAAGRRLKVTQEVAEFHEARGEVRVLGTV